jgi:uncharacterized integral membrane protein
MRLNARSCIAAVLFANLGLAVLGPAPLFAQKQSPTEPRVVTKRAKGSPLSDDEAAAEEKARWQQDQDRISEDLNRQFGRIRQDVTREALNRIQHGNSYARERMMSELIPFLVFVIILGAILWLVRVILDNRRWNKIAAIQTDAHNKLLERLASNQELLAYMESEAGRRFLESTPFEIDRSHSASLPYGRILWSAQIGVVIIMVGVAMLWLQNQIEDAAQALLVFGTLSLALGVGCLLSAGFSYMLSRSLGLLSSTPKSEHLR